MSAERCLKTAAGLVVLGMAYALKDYYSHANSESLFWILKPTALIVEKFSGLAFVHEIGTGWANLKHQAVIAPACAGVNFMIIAFCMAAFQGILWSKGGAAIAFRTVAAALSAYVLTIVANALRIGLSVPLYDLDIYRAGLTPEGVHRVAGVAIYYLFLCFYYAALSYMLKDKRTDDKPTMFLGRLRLLIPLFWYLFFALAVPCLNHAYAARPEAFLHHATSVFLTCAAITLVAGMGLALLKRRKKSRQSAFL